MARLFRLYEDTVVFSKANVKYYRRLGDVILYWVLALFFYTPLSSLALSYSKHPGDRTIELGFGTRDVITIFVAVLIIVISWVMEEGRKRENEQSYTV